jgi:hypothetical protein
MAVIYEGEVDKKLSFKIDGAVDGNILTVFDTKTGVVKGKTEVYVSNPRMAPSEDEVATWNGVAKIVATAE